MFNKELSGLLDDGAFAVILILFLILLFIAIVIGGVWISNLKGMVWPR